MSSETSKTSFGELELEIMSLLWSAEEPKTVAEIHTLLTQQREFAYTTVLTVLSNLYKKDAVDRARKGRAHVYWARQKRDQVAAGFFSNLLEKFYANNPAELVAGFLKTRKNLSHQELGQLKEELERLEQELD